MLVSDSGQRLYTGMKNGNINIWNLFPLKMETNILNFHKKNVTALLEVEDRYLISGANFDERIAIWDI